MKKNNNKGFSLVELIVVVFVMAVLLVVLAPAMLRYVEKGRTQKDETAVSEVINAVNQALADENINENAKVGDTVSCSDESITSSCDALLDEIHNTISDSDFKLTSKTHVGETYTINIVAGPDGVALKAEPYDDSHW